ncbi:MAG: hypothetical protein HYV32_04465 [Candidatus Kerfeldbacteria bacterium]|nr:hypothetical protein [Candidatus Kerfeldbacteria bacterium]
MREPGSDGNRIEKKITPLELNIDVEAEPVKNRERLQDRRALVTQLNTMLRNNAQMNETKQNAPWDMQYWLKPQDTPNLKVELSPIVLMQITEAYALGCQIAKAVAMLDATELEPAMHIHIQASGGWRSPVSEHADLKMRTAVNIVNTVLKYCEEHTPEIIAALNKFVAKQTGVSVEELTDSSITDVYRRSYLMEVANAFQRLDQNLPDDIEMTPQQRKSVHDFFQKKYRSVDTDFRHIYSPEK